MQTAVEVKNLTKVYHLFERKSDKVREVLSLTGRRYHKDFEALRGISFKAQKGECVGIIGLNGAGKSTLLKILTGVISPSAGTVKISGKMAALLELGAGFNPEYTGLENIYLNTLLMGYSREETDRKLNEIMEFADIGDFIHQPVKTYSSGMFVRLAFAIAVSASPDVLIIDEALSVGDVFFQQKCYRKIRKISENAAVLIVSHDLNAITKFCRRVLVLDEGRLVFDGEARSAVTEYYKIRQGKIKHAYVRESDAKIPDAGTREPPFRTPQETMYSGKMDAVIREFYYQVDDIPFARYCESGRTVYVKMRIVSSRAMDSVIFGYQVRDKFGNEVFGETSMTSGHPDISLDRGTSMAAFSFLWPEIREGDYFITLGIGEGYEVLDQVEQCWINQGIHLVSTTHGKLIYGIFNNTMENFRLEMQNPSGSSGKG